MKIVTIGRGESCDIVINDSQNLISRRHATLRIYPFGKMELIPEGRNGTFVNGFQIPDGVPRKVSRKDVISFAHVRQLNWKEVKDIYRIIRISAAIVAGVIALSIAGVLLCNKLKTNVKNQEPLTPQTEVLAGEGEVCTSERMVEEKPTASGEQPETKRNIEGNNDANVADSSYVSIAPRSRRGDTTKIQPPKPKKKKEVKKEKEMVVNHNDTVSDSTQTVTPKYPIIY